MTVSRSNCLLCNLSKLFLVVATLVGSVLAGSELHAQQAQWIWSPAHKKEQVPKSNCHFRKIVNLNATVEKAEILIVADDRYELYINARRVGNGETTRELDSYDVSKYFKRGKNVIAVKVVNQNGNTAALAARVMVKLRGSNWRSYSSDPSWVTSLNPFPLWNTLIYNSSRWKASQSFGKLGDTAPWDRAEQVPTQQKEKSSRFKIADEFEVKRVLDDEQTGSLIAAAFNEFGHLVAAREDGPLLLIYDSNDADSDLDKVRIYCDQVKNCQGILPLNGDVYVTGDGPDGAAMYRLRDSDRDGTLEQVETVIKFGKHVGEHGPHGITLGPDGLIYVMVGNHSKPELEYAETSPYRNGYDTNIVPKYEDPGGHAVGIKAPGGVVLRLDPTGKNVELFAGGIRNAYDLAFNRDGELFTYDSDMESDVGTTWYRPTRFLHVVAGGEYGWRSGWSKWPDYFVDNLPSTADTGRGSPTGMVLYNHYMFPARYHNAFFAADWSEGRILAFHLEKEGASYKTKTETFLTGQPLNVTDLDVGSDGWLYFVTGGRGTAGGVYQVKWKGTPPEQVRNLGKGIAGIIRQPQIQSAYGRQQVAVMRTEIEDQWARQVRGVALSAANPPFYRTRALDLLQLYGPAPASDFLAKMAGQKNEAVRAKAAQVLGLRRDEITENALLDLLGDTDALVRRRAAESLARAGIAVDYESLQKLLRSNDRFEAFAGRRLLEQQPVEEWKDALLATDNTREFIQGSLALVIAHPSKENAIAVANRIHSFGQKFVSDQDFVDLLRLLQVSIARGKLSPQDIPELPKMIAGEFPAGDPTMNREIVRLAAALQVNTITDRYMEHLQSDISQEEKLHLALHLSFVRSGWKPEQMLEILRVLESASKMEGGGSYTHYVMNVTRDFARRLDNATSRLVLKQGLEMPSSAVGALYKLPKKLDAPLLEELKQLDRSMIGKEDETNEPLRLGLVAVMARSGDDAAMSYLREVWKRDPERRDAVAMGLAVKPAGENWDYLVRSVPILEGVAARDVLVKLATVPVAPEDPEHIRQVIITGLKLEGNGKFAATRLLSHWTQQKLAEEGDAADAVLAKWQDWFRNEYPTRPEPIVPVNTAENKWTMEELLEHLATDEGQTGNPEKGAAIFAKAQCSKCHRFEGKGDIHGPDLTTVAKRFTRKELLESILYPSHVVSDQYRSKTVITVDGKQYTGIVAAGGAGEKIILQIDGKKARVPEGDIDEIVPSRTSVMPVGLLNELALDEISDLLSYMGMLPTQRLASVPQPPPK